MRPILIRIEAWQWEVQAYGVLLGLALIVGYVITLSLARRDKMPAESLGTAYVLAAAAALFVGRGSWILQHPEEFDGPSSIFTLQAGTLAPFAAMAAGLFISAALVNRRRVPVVAWFDVITPAFAVGVCFERIAALLAGTAAGVYAPHLPWAIRYPAGSVVFADHVQRLARLMPPAATESLPVHPAPLYGLGLGLLGVGLVVHQWKRRRFSGQVFLRYAIYFVACRAFIEEWFRADAASALVGPLNGGQVGSLIIIALLVVVHQVRSRAKPPLQAWEGGRWSPGYKEMPKRSKKGKKK